MAALPKGGFAPQSPRTGTRPTMSNFGAFIPRPQQSADNGAGGASNGAAPRSPRLSFDNMRAPAKPGATSPRGRVMSGSTSSGSVGFDFFAAAADFFSGAQSPRGDKPKESTSLKKALAARGGVSGVKDGYEAFYGLDNANVGNRSPRQSNSESNRSPRLKTRDGFDKFYGIQSRDKIDDEQLSERKNSDPSSTKRASKHAPVVPKGVPTFSLVEEPDEEIPAVTDAVETVDLSEKEEKRPLQEVAAPEVVQSQPQSAVPRLQLTQSETRVPTWAPPAV